jgi:hypothetical protein
MNQNLSLEERIQKIKDQITDTREYISSDFCTECVLMYERILQLEKDLKDLQNE